MTQSAEWTVPADLSALTAEDRSLLIAELKYRRPRALGLPIDLSAVTQRQYRALQSLIVTACRHAADQAATLTADNRLRLAERWQERYQRLSDLNALVAELGHRHLERLASGK